MGLPKPFMPTVVPSPTERYIKHYHDKFQKSLSREDAERLIKYAQQFLNELDGKENDGQVQ